MNVIINKCSTFADALYNKDQKLKLFLLEIVKLLTNMKRVLLFCAAAVMSGMLWAQSVTPLPTLKVDGKWLVDQHGNHVVLHGVMDTPNMYFNGWRWGSPWDGTNTGYNTTGASKCKTYFEKLFAGMQEAKCDVFRLHLDPAWTNDPSDSYTYAGAADQPSEATSEADIKKFNPTRLKNFMKTLYFPLAQKAMNHGMYVVMRPPGVCPPNLKVGDYYQQYLITVWDIVTQNDSVRKYAGQISIELANEPVNVKNKNNQSDDKALRDYFQPIVEKIRANGFTGIIWVPGSGWQSNYQSYGKYPVTGYNIGYAVHDYDGWYGCADSNLNDGNIEQSVKNKINRFKTDVPVVETNPIIITEVDWSPKNEGEGHYNEHGEWVVPNYGTWATGRTSYWGRCFKGVLDYYKNISMTLSGTACLFDIDVLLNNKRVVPAFGGLEEACGKACMDWYADYYQVDWAHADSEPGSETYETAVSLATKSNDVVVKIGATVAPEFTATFQDEHTDNVTPKVVLTSNDPNVITVNGPTLTAVGYGVAEVTASYTDLRGNEVTTVLNVKSDYFPLSAQYVNASLSGEGKYNESTHAMRPASNGQIGWEYPNGADFSAFKYLVVKLKQKQGCNAHVNIYTVNDLSGNCFSSEKFGTNTQLVINLQDALYTSGAKQGQKLNTKDVHIVSFWGNGSGILWLDQIYLTNNDDYSPQDAAAIQDLKSTMTNDGHMYDLQGRTVNGKLVKGLYIMNGKKIFIK